MRRILVEHARRKASLKRGGDHVRVALDPSNLADPMFMHGDDLLALDEALSRLAEKDKAAAELVQLRFFAGLTMQQAAEALQIPLRSAERLWTYGRAWLYRVIRDD